MHEYSIVSDLIDIVHKEALKHNASKVLRIIIEVGERSGVEANLLSNCFETFKEDSDLIRCSKLEIIFKKVKLHCNCCHKQFYADGLSYGICVQCGSSDVEIIEGKELHLLSLEME